MVILRLNTGVTQMLNDRYFFIVLAGDTMTTFSRDEDSPTIRVSSTNQFGEGRTTTRLMPVSMAAQHLRSLRCYGAMIG